MKIPGVLLIAFLQVTRVTLAGTECATFRPKTCLYDDSVTFSGRQCHPQTCNFDVAKEFECGFVESGTYSYEPEPAGGCVPDAFMSTRRAVPSPCGPRCCRADHAGDFAHKGSIHATNASAYEFQPIDNKCHYESISRGQILHYLHARGAILAVVGDSMMRQFFLRLVMMMRGQQRLLDYHLHTHAQYYVCSEVDVFRLARGSSNTSRASVDMEFLKVLVCVWQFKLGARGGGILGTMTSIPIKKVVFSIRLNSAQSHCRKRLPPSSGQFLGRARPPAEPHWQHVPTPQSNLTTSMLQNGRTKSSTFLST